MDMQLVLLVIVFLLILFDVYVSYTMYKQSEKDCTDLRYDVERLKTIHNILSRDVENHKDHINTMKDDIVDLNNEIIRLTLRLKRENGSKGVRRSKKEKSGQPSSGDQDTSQ